MKKDRVIIIIPVRYNSSRFPGKPLALIKQYSLIYRVWAIAKTIQCVEEVYIATDHVIVQRHALDFGAKVLMTGSFECGTERVFSAIAQLKDKPDIILNLQGDAVLTPPWVIQAVVETIRKHSMVNVVTPAVSISSAEYLRLQSFKTKGEVGCTMVVCDRKGNALYFSKSLIPYLRNRTKIPLLYRHIGLYGYRFSALEYYNSLLPSPLEQLEGLEQLRFLENGIPIRVIPVDYQGRTHASIDDPNDVERVERIIKEEGELISFGG